MNNIEHINSLLASVTRLKSKKLPYKKPVAVKQLEQLAFEFHYRGSSLPAQYRTKFHFRDDSANGLTICVVKYITLCGGFASRINNQGTYHYKLKKYIPGTSKKGLADVMATFRGYSLHLEIKHGRDQQSDAQKRIESEVVRAQGFYYLAKDFTSFKAWFDELFLMIS